MFYSIPEDYVMPAGSQCALLIYGVHYHPSWGPDVEKFRPERWLDPNNVPNPNMFAGFSIGKRACMGLFLFCFIYFGSIITALCLQYFFISISLLVFRTKRFKRDPITKISLSICHQCHQSVS